MKIALLGTGFGQVHAAEYAGRPDVDEVIVLGRNPETLAKVAERFGFATTTDLAAVLADASVDLVDICLPTRLHADVAVRAMRAGFTGRGSATLTEHTADGEPIDLPAASPYEAMIDHVLACLAGRADNQIEPASALIALELTLVVHQRLTPPAG